MKILVTGGAGFIGSHLCDALTDAGHSVRVLDALVPQVHGPWPLVPERPSPPTYLNSAVDFVFGDVRSYDDCRRALDGIEVVFHFAAHVGVGQSMYQPALYTDVNVHGTGVLLEEIAKNPVKKLIVASSMSVYGEMDGAAEVDDVDPRSVYALTKYDQEQLCLIVGDAHKIPTTALRFFNVYGPRQALSNPYTGVIAIFANRLLNDKPPLVYEDGMQTRDFVHVSDVVRGCMCALDYEWGGQVFNIGTGEKTPIIRVARVLAKVLGKDIDPKVTGTKRTGDVRHCTANVRKALRLMNYVPKIRLEDGLVDLAQWLKGQQAVDNVEQAARELEERGLVV